MNPFKKEILTDALGVFSTVAFFSYTWSMLVFLWELPSFLLRMETFDIISYVAYQLAFKLFSSTLITLFIIVLSFGIPSKYLRENLLASGSLLVFSMVASSLVFKSLTSIITWAVKIFSSRWLLASQISFGAYLFISIFLAICAILSAGNASISEITRKVVDRFSVLASIYVSLSILSIILVVYRNIP